MNDEKFSFYPGSYQSKILASLERVRKENIVERIWEHDHTVWKSQPTEISNRLGWLHLSETMMEHVPEIENFAAEMKAEGFTQALLLGMGGSSLAPEVFRRIFGVKQGYLDLAVLDSTTPGAVLHFDRTVNPEHTLYIASTKSGGTVETLSFTKYFYNQTLKKVGKQKVGQHFIAITDPGSGLESLAKELRFRKIFLNDPDIGGRYSVLSFFGLVPAGLIGMDVKALLDRVEDMVRHSRYFQDSVHGDNTTVMLGTILGAMARLGRDKLTFIISPDLAPFGVWVEQLIAESTGKEGIGILPVVDEVILESNFYAADRLFIYLKMTGDSTYDKQVQELIDGGFPVVRIQVKDKNDLGGEFFRWEMATAIAGSILGINPFDQPNVETAKILARKMMDAYKQKGNLPESEPVFSSGSVIVYQDAQVSSLSDSLEKFFNQAKQQQHGHSYVAIQAFIQPTSETDDALQAFRTKIQKTHRLATTVGYGPRFLHSTGQLHKGDGGNGLFIQITGDHPEDVAIPDNAGDDASSISFGVLALAQALGDRQALLDLHRKVIRFHLTTDIRAGISALTTAIK